MARVIWSLQINILQRGLPKPLATEPAALNGANLVLQRHYPQLINYPPLLSHFPFSLYLHRIHCCSCSLSLDILLFQSLILQNFDSPAVNFGSEGNGLLKQKLNSVSSSATASENVNGCFDCNICLDSSNEPVVTLCGHLFCWPCIYKWLQVQNTSPDSGGQPKCPVCKSYISTSSVVPLYGRGTSLTSKFEAKKPSQLDMAIPQRPPAIGTNAVVATATSVTSDPNQPNPFWPQNRTFHQHQYFTQPFGNYTATTNIFSPTINMVSEMVFARMFGSLDSSLFAHPYSNSYNLPGNGSLRMRGQEMQLDKSLNRVSIFLFCCIVLCLILF